MTFPPHDLPGALDPRAERAASAAARRHVGEAGWIQQNVLERIINAGREQLLVTQALRAVVSTTLAQLRATPLAEIGSVASVHLNTLQGIVEAGRAQIDTAHGLQLSIQSTLAQVRETPLEQVSGQLLTTLSASVHQQARDLEHIIAAAVGQASSVAQIAELERVGAEATERLRQAEHQQAERELQRWERHAAETLAQIRGLEQAGHSHASQKQQLTNDAGEAAAYLSQLQDTDAQDRLEIRRLEQQRDATSAQRVALETAAATTQETLHGLQASAEAQPTSGAARPGTAED